ncbi:MAG: PIN domain-containing protein [Opitutaceae bacterium]
MSWLLDADVLSQPVKTHGNRAVVAWLAREQAESYTSAIVIAQVAFWIRTREGRARERLQDWLTRSIDALEGRILSFNTATAHVWADQKALLDQTGRRMPVEDSYIAATARRHGLTIVTGNDKDFRRPGLKVFNPFKELPAI